MESWRIDGERTNNALANLEYATRQDNALHAHRIGLQNCAGEGNGQAKLTENDVLNLRSEYDGSHGFFSRRSRELGVSPTTVRDAVIGRTWSHLHVPEGGVMFDLSQTTAR